MNSPSLDDACNDMQERAHPSAGGNALYCVNGIPLLADHAYSVATTDYQDQNLVPLQLTGYYSRPGEFLTATIEDAVLRDSSLPGRTSTAELELDHQERGLFQLDIAKVVAGYSFRAAPKGDNFIASVFQGVSDARATSPSQSEVDIEAKERGIWRAKHFNFGVQSEAAYDRSVQGNLTGSPVNAAYPLNNFIVGGFLEFKITPRSKKGQSSPLGTLKVVLAPYQYQRQINGTYFFIGRTDNNKNQQAFHLSAVNGFSSSRRIALGRGLKRKVVSRGPGKLFRSWSATLCAE